MSIWTFHSAAVTSIAYITGHFLDLAWSITWDSRVNVHCSKQVHLWIGFGQSSMRFSNDFNKEYNFSLQIILHSHFTYGEFYCFALKRSKRYFEDQGKSKSVISTFNIYITFLFFHFLMNFVSAFLAFIVIILLFQIFKDSLISHVHF